MSVFLDTNVLAYLYDDAAPAKQQAARALYIERAADAVISPQVLLELHAVLTRKLGLSREAAARVVREVDIEVWPADGALVRRAVATATEHQLSISDAMILETAVSAGCAELLTEDFTGGATLRGVRVVNPFA